MILCCSSRDGGRVVAIPLIVGQSQRRRVVSLWQIPGGVETRLRQICVLRVQCVIGTS